MKHITRKTLGALLALVLVLALLPAVTTTAWADHAHHFTYSASGATITATCDAEGCNLPENKVTLTIVATTNLYANDGLSKEASLVGLQEYNAATGFNLSTDNIIYLKGTSSFSTAKIKNGTAGVSSAYEARIAYNGTDNFGNKVAKVSFALTSKPTPHTHVFTYAANGNIITATCTQNASNMEACDLTNKQATLTLNAPLHTTYGDGKNAAATFTGAIPGVNNPTINYRRSDTPLGTAAPVDAGTYTAWCQVGSATASVEYTIGKAANPGWATMPHAIENLVYTGSDQALITAGVAGGGNALYTVGTDPDNEPDDTAGGRPYTSSVPETTNAGTYYVWYKIDGGKNYTSIAAQKIAVTIAKADPTWATPTDLTATYGDTLSSVTLPEGWAWADGNQSVGNVGSNTFKANYTPADTGNYNTVQNVDVTVSVKKANITPTVSITGWTEGGKANAPTVNGNTGNGDVTFTYAEQGSQDFTEEVPTKAGKYTVKATVAETDNYNGATATADFTISRQIVDTTPVSGLTVTTPLTNVTRVTLNGRVVSPSNYTVVGGNVYFTEAFLATLASGNYTINLTDGATTVTATYRVENGTVGSVVLSATTADPGVALYAALALTSTLGLAWMGRKRKDD